MQKRVRLTQKLAGQTRRCAHVEFKNGEAILDFPSNQMEGVLKYLKRSYQVEEIPLHGSSDIQKDAERPDDRDLQESRRSAEESADDGGGSDAPEVLLSKRKTSGSKRSG